VQPSHGSGVGLGVGVNVGMMVGVGVGDGCIGVVDPQKTQYSRGLNDSEVSMVQTVIVNSGFINQPQFEFLEELYTSNLVYEIQTNGGLYPVNIINTEFERKIQGNRTIYNLELQYVYSNNIKLLGK